MELDESIGIRTTAAQRKKIREIRQRFFPYITLEGWDEDYTDDEKTGPPAGDYVFWLSADITLDVDELGEITIMCPPKYWPTEEEEEGQEEEELHQGQLSPSGLEWLEQILKKEFGGKRTSKKK